VKRLLAIIAILVNVIGPNRSASVCADDLSGAPPTVVEPGSGDAPAIVRLGANSDNDDPLKIGEFTLIDQNGETFDSSELEGHPWVAAFIFTRCAGYCPMLVRSLRLEVADRVEDPDVRFVVVSVDPEYDTPEQLRKFAEIWVSDFSRWVFLTGEKSEIFKLVQHGFRLPLQEMQGKDRLPGFEVAHSLSLIHVGADGRVIGKYDSRDEQQVLTLRRVLNGQMETPEANRIPSSDGVPEELTIEGPARARGSAEGDAAAPAGRPARGLDALPDWAARLPATNAMLNGLATLLLLAGFIAIRQGHVEVHKRLMMFAFATSVAFLASYLTYHFALSHYTGTHGKPFEGTGGVRTLYYGILLSHVLLATAVPVLALVTLYRGLREQWDAHRRIARFTFPIWLYVSVTGVIIYGMLYHWAA
jgi:protein SCO1